MIGSLDWSDLVLISVWIIFCIIDIKTYFKQRKRIEELEAEIWQLKLRISDLESP